MNHGQLQCQGCRVMLAYPMGAPSVRCPLCQAVTPISQIRITCVCCRTDLLLPTGTTLAMCPRCRTVMSIPSHGSSRPSGGGMNYGGPPLGPPKQVVYVEVPIGQRDAGGAMETTTLVGTKIDDDPS